MKHDRYKQLNVQCTGFESDLDRFIFVFLLYFMTKLHIICPFLVPPPSRMHDLSSKDCAACAEGYVSGYQYSCHSCQGSDKWTAIGGAVVVLVVVMFVVVFGVSSLVGVIDRPISERSGKWERRISNFRNGLVRAIPLTAIKIVLVSWQIITQVKFVVLGWRREPLP